ncbi:trypsin-like serine protease [Microvirga sp. Marseille-Q2068]|uniref:Trypsin-like serine protease n=2 Tax=Microvirga mediterraneensis TaxID=2754695 RepID=A0A838BTU1_9HYPH|nr:trypsin-like serine protease [Microvirga mediterraneensis]
MLAARERRRIGRYLVAWLMATALAWPIGRAHAVEGDVLARANDQLARSTVAVGTLLVPDGSVRLSHCSSVLIAPDLVLTAAHCIRDNPVRVVVSFYDGSRRLPSTHRIAAATCRSFEPGRFTSRDVADMLTEISLASRSCAWKHR